MSEKDLCKTLGAKWDKDKRKWYVPEGVDSKIFTRWFIDKSHKKPYLKLMRM